MSTHYERLGGEEGIRRLVASFYDLMDSDPTYAPIRALHAPSLKGSRDKLFLFLSGWTGGPPLYVEKHGHPQMRHRHLPFPIGNQERDLWMDCMTRAMRDAQVEESLQTELTAAFRKVADFIRNKPDEGASVGCGGH